MKIHEYQGKELLQKFNVPVPPGGVAETPAEARQVAESLERGPFVVKAQIHAGGRGKGGGIKPAATLEEVEEVAGQDRGAWAGHHDPNPEAGAITKNAPAEATPNMRSPPTWRSSPSPTRS